MRVKTRVDLAYYLAERCFVRNEAYTTEIKEEIASLIDSWDRDLEDRTRMSLLDSIGAIQIMTATNTDEVFKGHHLCSQAQAWSEDHAADVQVFNDYYILHTERARRRIQELPPLRPPTTLGISNA